MRGSAVVSIWQVMAWLALALQMSCAGSPIRVDGDRFSHRRHGYEIAGPAPLDGLQWTRVDVDGSDIAFRDGSGSTLSLMSDCKASDAAPQILAANLLLGLRPRETVTSGPYALGDAPGWHQTLLAGEDRRWVETVTIKAGGCVFDWVLISPAENEWLATAQRSLRDWIGSFRHPAVNLVAPAGAEGSESSSPNEAGDLDGSERS